MKQIKLIRMKFKDFKGLSSYELVLDGKNATVTGRNDDGKTTLAEGLTWLLFGKDVDGAKMNPKPLDEHNKEQLGLEPEIEADFLIDEQPITLKRVQKENWTKKNGALEKTRTSDTTKYFIDTVPKKEKEWIEFLSEILELNKIDLLIRPLAFMQMNWADRRKILIEMAGVSDEEIINQHDDLKELLSLLDGHTIEEFKKILAGQKKELAKNIEDIPGRIQENHNNISRLQLDNFTKEEVNSTLEKLGVELAEAENRLSFAKNSTAEINKQETISKLRLEQNDLRMKFSSNVQLATQALQEDVAKVQKQVNDLRFKKNEKDSEVYRLEQAIKEKSDLRLRLMEEYKQLTAKQKELMAMELNENDTVCPVCGTPFEGDKLQQRIAEFNKEKSTGLENIAASLEVNKQQAKTKQATKDDIEKLQGELKAAEQDLHSIKIDLDATEKQFDSLNQELVSQQQAQGKVEDTKEFKDLETKIQEVENTEVEGGNEVAIQQARTEMERIKKEQLALQQVLLMFGQKEQFEKRIEELRSEDAKLKADNLEIERKLFLVDEFTRIKVEYLEESINSKFEFVKFKLFEIQKNGGLKETCEALYGGVDYSKGLNNSAQIKAQIDIINALSKSFDVAFPLFIDNAEAVNEGNLPDSTGQQIELKVSEEPGLRVMLR